MLRFGKCGIIPPSFLLQLPFSLPDPPSALSSCFQTSVPPREFSVKQINAAQIRLKIMMTGYFEFSETVEGWRGTGKGEESIPAFMTVDIKILLHAL